MLKTASFCVLAALLVVGQSHIAMADIETKPIPFDPARLYQNQAKETTEKNKDAASDNAILNIKTINDVEPAAGQNPEDVTNDEIRLQTKSGKIAPGQKLAITVDGENNLTGIFPVNAKGSIDYPLLGTVPVEGLFPNAAALKIKTMLKNGYIVKPKVTVNLVEMDPIFIIGAVKQPGSYTYARKISISQALNIAGGAKDSADTAHFDVLREKEPHNERLENVEPDAITLQAGDILIVKELPRNDG